MIDYDEGRWSIGFAFQLHGSVLDKATAVAVPCALLTLVLHYSLKNYAETTDLTEDLKSNLHQGFTFVLGFLIVFRTQKAYSRWWEGGTLLQQLRGDWFNAFSNLMAFLNKSDDVPQKDVEEFKHMMVRLFSLLYGHALQQVMENHEGTMEYFDVSGFEQEHIKLLDETHDSCEVILQWIQRLLVEANTNNIIKIAPPILARVYNQLGQGIVKLNNARKIKQFPVPFSLAQLIAILLIIHWFTTTIMCAIMLSSPWTAGFTSFIVVVSFWGVNYIAVELENPYGTDPNDLPIRWMQHDLNESLIALLEKNAVNPPRFNYVEERDKNLREATRQVPISHDANEAGAAKGPTLSRTLTKWGLSHVPVPAVVVKTRSHGSQGSANSEPNRKPVEVDDCNQGNAMTGHATIGSAADSSYRDSLPNEESQSQPAAVFKQISAVVLGKRASTNSAQGVGPHQRAADVEAASPGGNSLKALLPSHADRQAGDRRNNLGMAQRMPDCYRGVAGHDPPAEPRDEGGGSAPSHGGRGPPSSQRFLSAAGAMCSRTPVGELSYCRGGEQRGRGGDGTANAAHDGSTAHRGPSGGQGGGGAAAGGQRDAGGGQVRSGRGV